MSRPLYLLCFILFLPLSACSWNTKPTQDATNYTYEQRNNAKQRTLQLFDDYYQFELEQSPTLRSRLGISGQFEWDDLSSEAREQRLEFYQSLRQELQDIPEDALDSSTLASYKTLLVRIEHELLMMPFDQHQYAFNQQDGWHTRAVDVLINYHTVSNLDEARDYVARLNSLPVLLKRYQENIKNAEDNGIIPPKFAFDVAISNINGILTGEPFNNNGVSPLWADFTSKLDNLKLYSNSRDLLERRARSAMLQRIQPAYERLLKFLEEQKTKAPEHQSAADLADGMRYYQLLLLHYSNSQEDANHIHQYGLAEVSRVQQQLRRQMSSLGYKGDDSQLISFFAWMDSRTPKFANNVQGRDEFMGFQRARIAQMAERLPFYVSSMPTAPLAIREVEPYRQQGSPIAFYQPPSLDGTRPGLYYVNTWRMNDISRHRLAALAYHESIPGHHLQVSLAQENENLPAFRRIISNETFSEGWALYAERLASEMNSYNGTEEEYGRLTQDLWRSARLVVDTGIHSRGWTRDQAIEYFATNTSLSVAEINHEINRIMTMPGQAISYKMGEAKLLLIRQQMQDKMGSRFDLPRFHAALLSQGTLPLDVLQEWMLAWADNPNKAEGKR